MTSRTIVTDPFDYVVFGGTGDLTRRKLLPALYQRELAGQLPSSARIIAVSHRPATTETYRQEIGSALRCTFPITEQSSRALHRFLARLSYIAADALSEEGWGRSPIRCSPAPIASAPSTSRPRPISSDRSATASERIG